MAASVLLWLCGAALAPTFVLGRIISMQSVNAPQQPHAAAFPGWLDASSAEHNADFRVEARSHSYEMLGSSLITDDEYPDHLLVDIAVAVRGVGVSEASTWMQGAATRKDLLRFALLFSHKTPRTRAAAFPSSSSLLYAMQKAEVDLPSKPDANGVFDAALHVHSAVASAAHTAARINATAALALNIAPYDYTLAVSSPGFSEFCPSGPGQSCRNGGNSRSELIRSNDGSLSTGQQVLVAGLAPGYALQPTRPTAIAPGAACDLPPGASKADEQKCTWAPQPAHASLLGVCQVTYCTTAACGAAYGSIVSVSSYAQARSFQEGQTKRPLGLRAHLCSQRASDSQLQKLQVGRGSITTEDTIVLHYIMAVHSPTAAFGAEDPSLAGSIARSGDAFAGVHWGVHFVQHAPVWPSGTDPRPKFWIPVNIQSVLADTADGVPYALCDGVHVSCPIKGLSAVREVSQGDGSGSARCVLMATGALRCMGQCNRGQCGFSDPGSLAAGPEMDSQHDLYMDAMPPAALPHSVINAASNNHGVCAVVATGEVFCFGVYGKNAFNPQYGAIGIPYFGTVDQVLSTEVPQRILLVSNDPSTSPGAVDISCFARGCCVLLRDGRVKCFGDNSYGALGFDSSAGGFATGTALGDDEHPWRGPFVELPGASGASVLKCGETFCCAVLSSTSAVHCWGQTRGLFQMMNLHIFAASHFAGATSPGDVIVDMTATKQKVCVLTAARVTTCFGHNENGYLGIGATTSAPGDAIGQAVFALPIVALSQSNPDALHSCAILVFGEMQCWGRGDQLQLGTGGTGTIGQDRPINVYALLSTPLRLPVMSVSVTSAFTCVVSVSGYTDCFGSGFGSSTRDFAGTREAANRNTAGGIIALQRMPCALVAAAPLPALQPGLGGLQALQSVGSGLPPVFRGLDLTLVYCSEFLLGSDSANWGMRNGSLLSILPGAFGSLPQSHLRELDLGGNRLINAAPALTSPGGQSVLQTSGWFTFGGSPGGSDPSLCLPADVWGSLWDYTEDVLVFFSTQRIDRSLEVCSQVLAVSTLVPAALPTRGGLITLQVDVDQTGIQAFQTSLIAHPAIDGVMVGSFVCSGARWCVVDNTVLSAAAISQQCQEQRRRTAGDTRGLQQTGLIQAAFVQCELGAGSGRDLPVTVTWQGQALSVSGTVSFAPPLLQSALPAVLATNNSNSARVRFTGANFGNGVVLPRVELLLPAAAAPSGGAWAAQPAVQAGQRRACTAVIVHSHEEISCVWPAGFGSNIVVEVELDSVTGTGAAGVVRYAAARISRVLPVSTAASTAARFVTRGGQRWHIHGEHFGVPTLSPQRWVVVHRPAPMADFLCQVLACASDTLCECDSSPEGVGEAHGVSMVVQDSLGATAPVFSYFAPEILGVFPFESLPAEGDDSSMVVLGTSFGWQDYGAVIEVGGRPCPNTVWSPLTTDTVLRCPVPPGFGSNVPVRVSVFGQTSELNPSSFVSYKLPLITSVQPSEAVLALDSPLTWWESTGTQPIASSGSVLKRVDITVRGASIAPSAEQLLGICFGSAACSQPEWLSTDSVVCRQQSLLHTSTSIGAHPITVLVSSNETAPGTTAAGLCADTETGLNYPRCEAAGVTCVAGGYEGASRLAPAMMRNFSIMAPPAVTDIVPRLGSPGAQVSILGSNFGWQPADVVDVLFVPLVGGASSVERCAPQEGATADTPAFSWVSSTTIKCVAPQLPLGSARIVVVSRGGFYNTSTGGVRYAGVSPEPSGSAALDVDVFSTPASPSKAPLLANVTKLSSGQLAIRALLALDVAVLDGSSMDITRFHALLATNASVLHEMRDYEKDEAVETLQADNQPYALFNSGVSAPAVAGGHSRITAPELQAGELASYETADIVAEEQLGLFRVFVVDVAESRAVYASLLANTSSSGAPLSLAAALPGELQAPLVAAAGIESLSQLQFSEVDPALWLQYMMLRTDAPVSAPLHVAIRAVNDAEPGLGPWSQPSLLPALPRCTDAGEYLQSHLQGSSMTCAPCPEGAVCSDAEGWEHVRNNQGRFLLRTAPATVTSGGAGAAGGGEGERVYGTCPIAAACPSVALGAALSGLQQDVLGSTVDTARVGVSHVVPYGALLAGGTLLHVPLPALQAFAQAAESPIARRALQAAAPGTAPSAVDVSNADVCELLQLPADRPAELVPSICRPGSNAARSSVSTLPVFSVAFNGQADPAYFIALRQPCAEGYFGTLCSACDVGYARAPAARECVACAGRAAVYVLLILGVILGAIVLGYLISSTLASRGRSSALYVSMNKLTLVHLQQISLAASFNLRWPKVMTDLFAGMNAASTVSESTLSTECVSQPFVFDSMFLTNTAVTLLLPLMLLGTIALFWAARALCTPSSSRPGSKWAARHSSHGWTAPARRIVNSLAKSTRRLPDGSSQEVGDSVATNVTKNPLQPDPGAAGLQHAAWANSPQDLGVSPGVSIGAPPSMGPAPVRRVLPAEATAAQTRAARMSITHSVRSMFTSPMFKGTPVGPSAARQSRASIVQFSPVLASGGSSSQLQPAPRQRTGSVTVRKEAPPPSAPPSAPPRGLASAPSQEEDFKRAAGEVVAPRPQSVFNPARAARMAAVHSGSIRNAPPGPDEVVDGLPDGMGDIPLSSQLKRSVDRLRSHSASRGMVVTRGRRSSSAIEDEPTGALTGLIVSVVVASFLLHMTLTRAAAQLVTCAPLTEGDADEFLIADPNVPCSGEESGFLFGAGAAAFLCYAIGIPALSSLALWAVRGSLEDDTVRQRYGFLYSSYHTRVYFWEIVIMVRKVALTTVAVALAPAGLDVQVIVAVTILFSSALLHTSVKPYRMPVLNQCELLSLVVAFMTLVGGLLLDSERVTSGVKQTVTVLLVMQNVLLLVYFFIILMSDAARVTHTYILEYVQIKQEQQAKAERRAPGAQPLSARTLKFVQWVIATEERRMQLLDDVAAWRVKWCGASLEPARESKLSAISRKRNSSTSSARRNRRTSFMQ